MESVNVKELEKTAKQYRAMFHNQQCSLEEAKEHIAPYLEEINKKSKELSKKYNQKYKPVGFSAFMR